jgi:hypothetical protein
MHAAIRNLSKHSARLDHRLPRIIAPGFLRCLSIAEYSVVAFVLFGLRPCCGPRFVLGPVPRVVTHGNSAAMIFPNFPSAALVVKVNAVFYRHDFAPQFETVFVEDCVTSSQSTRTTDG